MNICITIKGPILLELLPFVILNAFCLCIPQILLKQSDTLLTQYRHIEHLCEEKFDAIILIFDKMIALST